MQIKSIAECSTPVEHSAVLLTSVKVPHGFKTFVLSVFEWPLKVTAHSNNRNSKSSREVILGSVRL